MKNNDIKILESLIAKYGKSNVNLAINRLNEESDDNISYKEARELLDKMFDEYVPNIGKADTLGGEILRAFARLYYRCYNDGDVPYIDYGNETCNSSYRFLHNNHVPGFENEYPSQTFYKEWMTYLNKIIVLFYLWISDEEREQYFTISNNVDSRKPSEEDLEWDEEDDMWDDYDDLDESLNENYNFNVNETGAISRNEIENHGWETQLRNLNKKSKDAIYASLYCWLPNGEYLDEVPEQLQSNVISWESNLFGVETEVGLVPDNAYLMHGGECVVINGYIRML